MSTAETSESMDVAGTPSSSAAATTSAAPPSSVPTLQIGGPGYGIIPKTIFKPCMSINPDVAHLIGRRPPGGGGAGRGQFGLSGRPPPFLALQSQASAAGITAGRVQEALVSNRLAQAVGELATIQIRDALEKAFFPISGGLGQNNKSKGQMNNLRDRLGLGLGHGRIIKTGGGGSGKGGAGHGRGRKFGGDQKPGSSNRMIGSNENHRWGGKNKWGKDANKQDLDAELDQYIAQRHKKSGAALDAELDLYHSRAAAARDMNNYRNLSKVFMSGHAAKDDKDDLLVVDMLEDDGAALEIVEDMESK